MTKPTADVVVAGHICLDIIPDLSHQTGELASFLVPGKLIETGPAMLATGGAVSNTGLALHRIGVATTLMGKVGADAFGDAILNVVRQRDPALAEGMIVSRDAPSSYTVVINLPGTDRIFLHCPGANDTFRPADIDTARIKNARLFHFGYPPLMDAMFRDDGLALAGVLSELKRLGVTTSLDMARPDPDSAAGRADWEAFLRNVLPHVDIFLPSIDETLYMINRPLFQRIERGGRAIEESVDGVVLAETAQRLLDYGVAVAGLKLGAQGFYVRTATDAGRFRMMGRTQPADPAPWCGRELYTPCFDVVVAGATGAGDCTIAGFLAGLLRGLGPVECLEMAAATGACKCERADAISGVRTWEDTRARIAAGWRQHPIALKLEGGRRVGSVWHGPRDGR